MTRTAVATTPTPLMADFLVQSDLLGTFTVAAASIMEFPEGLLGFPECRRYALMRAGTESIYWLQSLDFTSLVFLLIDPFPYFADYSVDIPAADALALGASDSADVAVFAIVTLPPPSIDGARPTANLQGPVAINLRVRLGMQVICTDSDRGVRCPLDLA
ncbi:MAG TPA: flagellar assembly protein FliW, partial [Gemmatimonadaceae bacterium]|nr:flagellar assembly protein FliW [Gemmatimonadaceae bacterium]